MLDVACHCEEPFGFPQDKLRDEAILMELQGFRDCFASLAMTPYIATILRNQSTRGAVEPVLTHYLLHLHDSAKSLCNKEQGWCVGTNTPCVCNTPQWPKMSEGQSPNVLK